jgi:APA family basic amino acid/polyamine antiporter
MLSAIFVLPGLAAEKTGASIWLAYLVAGLAVLPAALCKAELATAMPASGGTYVYMARAFGPLVGTIAGLGLWLSLLLKSAFSLVGFGAYLVVLADLPIKPMALSLLVALTALNVLGVRKVSKAQLVAVGLSVGGLTLFCLMSIGAFDSRNMEPLFPEGSTGFLAAAGFLFVSYAGVTKVAALAEEVKNPDKNLPLAIIISLTIAIVIYAAVSLALAGVVPIEQLKGDLKPIYTLAYILGGSGLGALAAVLAIITMAAMATAGLLAASRFPFAMSRDQLLPSKLTFIHPRFKTPVVCIIGTSVVMGIAIVSLDVMRIAKLASAFKILIFMGVNLAVIVLRESRLAWYKPAYRSPFYPWVPILGIAMEAVLLIVLGLGPAVAALGLAILGAALFYTYGRKRTTHRGVISMLGPRRELIAEARVSTTQTMRQVSPNPPTVIVALVGEERSPETLADIGAALAGGRPVQVVYVEELPEQTLVVETLEDSAVVNSLARRFKAMSDETGHDIRFMSAMTHDPTATIHRIASSIAGNWAVLEWGGHSRAGRLLRNPRAWLHRHMPCNLALFHDTGVRYIREIMVYAEPGPDDALVVTTADHLAQRYGGRLTFVRYVAEGADPTQVQSQADYLDQLRMLAKSPSTSKLVRGSDYVAAMSDVSATCDLLVMGAPRKRGLRAMFGTDKDRLTEAAACSVLRLQTPHEQFHVAVDQHRDEEDFELLSHVGPGCLGAGLLADTKESLFDALSHRLEEAVPGASAAKIKAALWERERTQNTGVGMGVALPHATLPEAEETVLAIYTTRTPIEYGGMDEQPVDVCVVTVGPPSERQAHLLLLATISRLILKTDLLSRLREAESDEAMYEALKASLRDTETKG